MGKSPEKDVGAELTDGAEDAEGPEDEDGAADGTVDKEGVADGSSDSEGAEDGAAVGPFVGLFGSIDHDDVGDVVGVSVKGDPVGEPVVGD